MKQDPFEDLQAGQETVFSRLITREDVQKFVELTGDCNPLHVNDAFAIQNSFEGSVVHGMLTASFISTVIGTKLPGPGSLWYENSFRFLAPVYVGQTIQIKIHIRHKSIAQRVLALDVHVTSDAGQVVVEGEAKVKLLKNLKMEKKK